MHEKLTAHRIKAVSYSAQFVIRRRCFGMR
jgi:hypothetical protein